MVRSLQRAILLGCLVAVCAGLWSASAQVRSKRLVLKDGSYQPVREWEIKGERVRYFSSERYAWEEIPKALVDWEATEKYNASLTTPSEALKAYDVEEAATRAREEAASPAVAEGVRLPPEGGVFLLDTWRGQPQLVELEQNGGELNRQRGTNILRAAINPLASTKQSIELKGVRATVQAHVEDPVFYLNVTMPVEPDVRLAPSQAPEERFRIVRVEPKKNVRVLGTVKINMLGRMSEQQAWVKSTLRPLSGGWVRLAPAEKLAPGEYALVEMLEGGQMNLYVWDFGVNPAAPQNKGAWTASEMRPAPAKEEPAPELKKKKDKP